MNEKYQNLFTIAVLNNLYENKYLKIDLHDLETLIETAPKVLS